MHLSSATLLTLVVSSASATLIFPDSVPLHRRQAPGTPEYDCHADCGGVITLSRTENHCTSSNFTSQLTDCLDCANQFDIWQYYGNSVSAAASACGLSAEPVAVNGTTSAVISSTMTTGSGTASASGSATTTASSDVSTTSAATSENGSASPTTTASAGGSSAAVSSATATAASGGLTLNTWEGCSMSLMFVSGFALLALF